MNSSIGAVSTVVKKLFADPRKEEEWLNDMSAQGKMLVSYNNGAYTFINDEPDTYQFAVEILGNGKYADQEYLSFLGETGVELVSSYAGRVYLRKKNDGTPFELHSDLESRLEQARKSNWWTWIAISQASVAVFIAISAVVDGASTLALSIVFGMAIILIIAAAVEYFVLAAPARARVRQLKHELRIRE